MPSKYLPWVRSLVSSLCYARFWIWDNCMSSIAMNSYKHHGLLLYADVFIAKALSTFGIDNIFCCYEFPWKWFCFRMQKFFLIAKAPSKSGNDNIICCCYEFPWKWICFRMQMFFIVKAPFTFGTDNLVASL